MIVYIISYAVSFLLAAKSLYYLSGMVLIGSALYQYWYDYKQTENFINLRGMFSLFWIGGQGISCLKLSRLQTDWGIITWICFFMAYVGFYATFEILQRRFGKASLNIYIKSSGLKGRPVFESMAGVTFVSLAAFLTEAFILGFVPLFLRGVPHAYSAFHISGLHYFTVSCVLVPSLCVIYFHTGEKIKLSYRIEALIMTSVSLMIPILCVSRFQIIFAVAMALLTYVLLNNKIKPLYFIMTAAVMIPVYLVLSMARSHDVAYLNGIFEMKYDKMPIFVTQPYMYIANNYDNFNCLTNELTSHTFGLKMMFPVWALTGLKFVFPQLVSFPLFVTKEELTTVTLFYDAYYDFGVIGVLALSCILGGLSYYVSIKLKNIKNPIGILFYSQIGLYLMLSFFTTWFSNPATWFYFVITLLIYIYCSIKTGKL